MVESSPPGIVSRKRIRLSRKDAQPLPSEIGESVDQLELLLQKRAPQLLLAAGEMQPDAHNRGAECGIVYFSFTAIVQINESFP